MFKKLTIIIALLCGAQAYGMDTGAAGSKPFSSEKYKALSKKVANYKELSTQERAQVKAEVLAGICDGNSLKVPYRGLQQGISFIEEEEAEEAAKLQKDEPKMDEKKNQSWFSNIFTLKKAGLFAIGTLIVYGCMNFFKKRSSKKTAGSRK